LLDRIGVTPYPRAYNWHSESAIAKDKSYSALGGVEYARISSPPSMAIQPGKPGFQRELSWLKSKFRPLHDRVVVKRIDAEEKTKGGIIIPDTAKEKPSQGEITAVGPGGRDEAGKLIPIDVKIGDRVLFGKWSGTEIKLDGEELLIMKESDIMGVLA